MKLVRVEWDDACAFSDGWIELGHAREHRPLRVANVGYLLADEPGYVVLTAQIMIGKPQCELVGTVHVIPKGCISKMEVLS